MFHRILCYFFNISTISPQLLSGIVFIWCLEILIHFCCIFWSLSFAKSYTPCLIPMFKIFPGYEITLIWYPLLIPTIIKKQKLLSHNFWKIAQILDLWFLIPLHPTYMLYMTSNLSDALYNHAKKLEIFDEVY